MWPARPASHVRRSPGRSRTRAASTDRRGGVGGSATLLAVVTLAALCGSCSGDGSPTAPRDLCGPFADWTASPYVLPYPVGTAYHVSQANCSGFGHSGFWRYGYDFDMSIGTLITAARAGTVIHSLGGASDGDRGRTNLVTIQHEDGTVALYSHLTRDGNLVASGQTVQQGDPVGLSGDTGNTGGLPHLHFSVHPCSDLPGLPGEGSCPSQPETFRNTSPNPEGLVAGRAYAAEPWG